MKYLKSINEAEQTFTLKEGPFAIKVFGDSSEYQIDIKAGEFSFMYYPDDEDWSDVTNPDNSTVPEVKAILKRVLSILTKTIDGKCNLKSNADIKSLENIINKEADGGLFGGETYNGWEFNELDGKSRDAAVIETGLYVIAKCSLFLYLIK